MESFSPCYLHFEILCMNLLFENFCVEIDARHPETSLWSAYVYHLNHGNLTTFPRSSDWNSLRGNRCTRWFATDATF